MISPVLPTYARADLVFERGEGAWLYTKAGEGYLDFAGGVAVNALGHAHPHLVDALVTQANKVWHTSNLYRVEGQEKVAERLIRHSFADTVFFANSGAEAVECAIKMTRHYHSFKGETERYRIISFEGAFHGRTLATIAAGGQKKHLDGFGPKVDGFDQVGFGDTKALAELIGPHTAAILLEPIQGEGGIHVFSHDMLRRIKALARENGLLLIYDEVQCGMGRTGKLFAHEWSGVAPDIMALAKSLGGGFPVGACLATKEASEGMIAGTHGSTFGGNPLAMAAANAVLDIMLEPDFFPQVQRRALHLRQMVSQLLDEYSDIFSELRGEGLMLGLKAKVDPGVIVKAALSENLLLVAAGDNVVRLLPPIILTEEDMSKAREMLIATAQKTREILKNADGEKGKSAK